MRIHVLGIGSIGTLVAHHLRLNNPKAPITLIYKGAPRPENFTLKVEQAGETTTSTGFDLEPWTQPDLRSRELVSPIDSIIVCLKTHMTLPILASLKPRLSASSVVTLLQNGMGVFDDLCRNVWPEERTRPQFIIGTTTHGVSTPASTKGFVLHKTKPGLGEIKFGVVPDPRQQVDLDKWLWNSPASSTPILAPPSSPSLPLPPPPNTFTSLTPLHNTLSALLSLSHLSPTLLPMPHLHHQLLVKLALNSVINPLTAVIGAGSLTNGVLSNDSVTSSVSSHKLIKGLARETSEVLVGYLHSLASPHTPPSDVLRLFAPDSIENQTHRLLRSTAENKSSMAYDVSRGRSTEIDYINGYLITLGQRLGVPTPRHQQLVDMVKFTSEVNRPHGPLFPRLQDRRDIVAAGWASPKQLSSKQLEWQEKKMELDERTLWAQTDVALEMKRNRRKVARLSESIPKRVFIKLRRDRVEEGGLGPHGGDEGGGEGEEASSTSPSIAPPPANPPMASWMDSMISAAPRIERTWDVPESPTAKASSSKKKEKGTTKQVKETSQAPKFTDELTTLSSRSEIVSSFAPQETMTFHPLDNLIASSPRASRTWDVHGATITSLGVSSGKSFAETLSTSTSNAGLGSTLNDLIAGAPRFERTWPSDRGSIPISPGRFTTSRTSGS